MPKRIEIRNVPGKLYEQRKARAAKRGMSLSAFLIEIAERAMAESWAKVLFDPEEFFARVRRIAPDTSDFDSAAYIRRHRDAG
ncbi:MAG: hypothetical protein JNM66_19000 [Bryobacterales bacterium]|nr:hypothetical protein [Bryobacterales bacterium]